MQCLCPLGSCTAESGWFLRVNLDLKIWVKVNYRKMSLPDFGFVPGVATELKFSSLE